MATPSKTDGAILGAIVPIRVNGLALAAGYVGILWLLMFGGPGAFVAGALFAAPKTTLAMKAGMLAGALIVGVAPPLLISFLAQRSLTRSEEKAEKGWGRVITGYVCAILIAAAFVGGILLALSDNPA